MMPNLSPPRTRRLMAAVVLLCAAMVVPSPARAEICNIYLPLPSFDVNIFNITIEGNVLSDLNLNVTATNGGLNPFVYVGGTSTVTAALDGNGNTVVTFTGSKPINSSDQFTYGPPGSATNYEPHIGVDGSVGGGALLPVIADSFSNSNTSQSLNLPAPVLLSTPPPPNGASDIDWLIFFAQVTDPGLTTGEWYEAPIDGSKTPTLTLTNYSANTDTLSGAGYYISENEIPLDQLNFGENPPPSYPGSPFIPLPSLDGQTLSGGDGIGGAGGSIGPNSYPDLGAAPEPSSLTLLLTGGSGGLIYGWRRRKRIAGESVA